MNPTTKKIKHTRRKSQPNVFTNAAYQIRIESLNSYFYSYHCVKNVVIMLCYYLRVIFTDNELNQHNTGYVPSAGLYFKANSTLDLATSQTSKE